MKTKIILQILLGTFSTVCIFMSMDKVYGGQEERPNVINDLFMENSGEQWPEDSVPIDKEHFPDEAFRQYILSLFRPAEDHNEEIPLFPQEIQLVKSISVNNRGIKDLRGIEYFTELESLSCYNNELEELDLRKNRKLRHLVCEDNNLKSLKINSTESLDWLKCKNNELKTIDFGETPYIDNFECKNNRLTELNLIPMGKAWCDNNSLTKLVTKDAGSTLERLYCQNNQLLVLDIRENPRLRDVYCYNNQLADIIVGEKNKIRNLNCENNRITNLDLREAGVSYLWCRNNLLTTLKVKKVKEIIAADNPLKILDVSNARNLEALEVDDACEVNYADIPELIRISNGENVKITWKYPKYCDGFFIYRKDNGSSWKKIGEIRKKNSTGSFSYVDKSATEKKTYTYTVRAVRTLRNSEDSESRPVDYRGSYDKKGLTVVRGLPRPEVKAKRVNHRLVELNWKKIPYAQGYTIYRKESAKDTYKKLASVKSDALRYRDKKVQKGKAYTYRIRAHRKENGKMIYSQYDTVKVSGR